MTSKDFSAWRFLGVAAAILLGATLVAGMAGAPFLLSAGEDKGLSMLIVYTAQFSLACAGVWWWLSRQGLVRPRFGVGRGDVLIVAGGVVLLTAAGVVLEPLLDLFPDRYWEELDRMIGTGVWMTLATVVAAPVLEELLFRGLILEGLLRRWSVAAAVTTSAALFGAAHLPNFPQALNAFVMAAAMGYIYVLAGRRLVPVILLHFANNGAACIALRLTGSSTTGTRDLIASDALYWTLYAVSAAIFIGSMAVMVRVSRNKMSENALAKGV